MTDRFDSSDGSPEELRDFIVAEKACPDPAPDVQARVFARVASTVGFVPAAGDIAGSGAPTASATTRGGPAGGATMARLAGRVSRRGIATFLLGAAVGGATVGTVDHVRNRQPGQASSAVSPAGPPAPLAPPASLPSLASLPQSQAAPAPSEPSTNALVRRGMGGPVAAVAPRETREAREQGLEGRDKGLEAERKLVEMARTALARGHTAGALAALRKHQRSFPGGQLAEERDGLWVSALVATGEYAQAREQAARFRRHYPHSLFAPVVEQAIRSIP